MRRVVTISSMLGTAMPLGWLWASTAVVALTANAASTTLRTLTSAVLTLPSLTMRQASGTRRASRHSSITVSSRRPRNRSMR